MKRFERILFLRTDRMGDVLMNLPTLRLLRQTYPKSWITVAIDRSLDGLLSGHPDVDEVMLLDASGLRKKSAARRELCRKLRRADFDLAIVSNPERWAHALVFWAGIPTRVGWRRKWSWLLTRTLKDEKSGRHEIESNLALVGLVTEKIWDGGFGLTAEAESQQFLEDLLAQDETGKGFIAIHAGTSHPAKRWAPERFAEVSDHFQRKGFKTVLIGGKEEAASSEAVLQKCAMPPRDFTGRFSLGQLRAFLGHSKVKLLVSSDSGPVHVAWMQKTPVVALYSKGIDGSNPARWGPRIQKSRVIHDFMGSITATKVCALAEELLA